MPQIRHFFSFHLPSQDVKIRLVQTGRNDAAVAQIRKGVMTSLSNAVQMALAKELTKALPCAQ